MTFSTPEGSRTSLRESVRGLHYFSKSSCAALRLDLDDILPMFLYVYRLMLCNFLFENLDQVSRI